MYETLTKRLSKVIKQARAIAAEVDCQYLGSEHVLLAIAMDGENAAARILRKQRIEPARIKAEIDALVRQSLDDTWVFGRLPGSPDLKAAITRAIELAGELNTRQIGAEHLLLAFLELPECTAARVLSSLGLSADTVRRELSEQSF